MKKMFACFYFLLINHFVIAQDNENRFDNFYLEAGGAGIAYSLNFERALPDADSRQTGTIFSLGFNVFPTGGSLLGSYCRYFTKNKQRQYIYGLGATAMFYDGPELFINIPITYKYTFPNNRVYVGATLYGLYSLIDSQFIPWGGLRVGYNFKMRCKYCRSL